MFHDREEGEANSKRRSRKVPARKAGRYRKGDWALGRRGKDWVAQFCGDGIAKGGRGPRVRIGEHTSFEAACRALDAFVEKSGALKRHEQALTCEDIWRAWMKEREANKYPCAIYWHQWKALGRHFGHRTPGMMTAQDWRDYADHRINELGRSPSTVHTELVRLRAALAWAVKADLIPKAPLDYIPTPSAPRDRVLSRWEALHLLRTAKEHSDPHIHLFIVLGFNTGARHRAILDLTWDRVDFASGIIDYDDDLPKDPLAKSWRKGRATVLMSKEARLALETAWNGRQTNHVVEHGGRRLVTVREGFKNAAKRAGLGWIRDGEFETDVTPHTLRHTFITRMQTRRVHTKLTAMFVGHGDEDTTNKVYTHLDVEALRDVVAAVDEEFSEQPALPLNGEILPPEQESEEQFKAILSRLGRRLDNSGFGEDEENA